MIAVWPYSTQRWQRLREAKLSADPICEYRYSGCTMIATEPDHKKPINKGGDPWAWDNLASACHSCHSQKTYHVDTKGKDSVPVKGCDSDGWPLDPAHHWKKAGVG